MWLFCHLHIYYLYILCELCVQALCSFFKKDFIYLLMRDRDREAETQADGEAGSMQGAWCGTWSRVSRIMSWAEGGAKPPSHPGVPIFVFFR